MNVEGGVGSGVCHKIVSSEIHRRKETGNGRTDILTDTPYRDALKFLTRYTRK